MLRLKKLPPPMANKTFTPGSALVLDMMTEPPEFSYLLETDTANPKIDGFIKKLQHDVLDGVFCIYKPIGFNIVGDKLTSFTSKTSLGQMPIYLSQLLQDFVFLDIPSDALRNTDMGPDTFMLQLINDGEVKKLFGKSGADLSSSLFSSKKSTALDGLVKTEINIYFSTQLGNIFSRLDFSDIYPILGQTFLISDLLSITQGKNRELQIRFNQSKNKINKDVFYKHIIRSSEDEGGAYIESRL